MNLHNSSWLSILCNHRLLLTCAILNHWSRQRQTELATKKENTLDLKRLTKAISIYKKRRNLFSIEWRDYSSLLRHLQFVLTSMQEAQKWKRNWQAKTWSLRNKILQMRLKSNSHYTIWIIPPQTAALWHNHFENTPDQGPSSLLIEATKQSKMCYTLKTYSV